MAGTGWKPGERPAWVQTAIDGVVDPLLEAARERFDADQLCDEAQLITGLYDFGQDDFRERSVTGPRVTDTWRTSSAAGWIMRSARRTRDIRCFSGTTTSSCGGAAPTWTRTLGGQPSTARALTG